MSEDGSNLHYAVAVMWFKMKFYTMFYMCVKTQLFLDNSYDTLSLLNFNYFLCFAYFMFYIT